MFFVDGDGPSPSFTTRSQYLLFSPSSVASFSSWNSLEGKNKKLEINHSLWCEWPYTGLECSCSSLMFLHHCYPVSFPTFKLLFLHSIRPTLCVHSSPYALCISCSSGHFIPFLVCWPLPCYLASPFYSHDPFSTRYQVLVGSRRSSDSFWWSFIQSVPPVVLFSWTS